MNLEFESESRVVLEMGGLYPMHYDVQVRDYKDTLKACADIGGVDLICTSPPYDDARTYSNDISWRYEDYQTLGDEIFKALKPGGQVLLNLSGPVRDLRGLGSERSMTPFKVYLDWAERVGFRAMDMLAYGRNGSPGEYRGRFRQDWEPLMWFVKPGGDKVYFDKHSIAEDAVTPMNNRKKSSNRRKDGTMYVREASGWAVENQKKHRGTFWQYGSVGYGHDDMDLTQTKHPARFALKLAQDIVSCFCPPEGIVSDPFTGSGTTAVAALTLGRGFIGGDLYADANGVNWVDHVDRITDEIRNPVDFSV